MFRQYLPPYIENQMLQFAHRCIQGMVRKVRCFRFVPLIAHFSSKVLLLILRENVTSRWQNEGGGVMQEYDVAFGGSGLRCFQSEQKL